jgi:gliding motility-associated-like protein
MCADAQQTIQLNGNYTNGYNNPRFQWQIQSSNSSVWDDIPGATGNNYLRTPTAEGTYSYRLSIAEGSNINSPACRIYSNPVTIFVEPNPDAQLTSYVYGCYGGTVVLYAAGGSSYFWTGPNGFSSNQQLVTLPNIQFTDAGKYKVRVTTSTGCPGTDSLNLIIYPAANISVSGGASVCEGTPVNLNATGGLRFVWWPSEGLSNDTISNPVARPSNSTIYSVRVTNQYGCSDTGSVSVNVWKKPKADAGPDKKIRPGLQVQLEGKIIGNGADYFWTPLDFMTATTSLRPVVSPPATTTYTLHANSREGCGSTSDEVKVVVYDKIIIPNAFSPNNDAINDTWFIEPLYLFPECKVEVYNRYGEIVYRSSGYDHPWDGRKNGRPLPTGVYYYIIDLKERGKLPLTGSLMILK